MDTVILSTLLFNSFGLVVVVLSATVTACLPDRRRMRGWVLTGADAATRSSAPAAVQPLASEAELPRAA